MQLIILTCVALAVGTNGGPIYETRNTEWWLVEHNLDMVQHGLTSSVKVVKREASEGNQEVGAEISLYFDSKIPDLLASLELVKSEAEAQTLTFEAAHIGYFTNVHGWNSAQATIERFSRELPTESAETINLIMSLTNHYMGRFYADVLTDLHENEL